MDDTPALFFHPDSVESDEAPLVGRRSAGTSLLRAFCRWMPGDQLRFVVENPAHQAKLRAALDPLDVDRPVHIDLTRGTDFLDVGTIFLPGPGLMNLPWIRNRVGGHRCSFVGITHTVSTKRVMQGLHDLIAQPVEPWDAIICTSRSVQSVLERAQSRSRDFVSKRFGGEVTLPQLPVIPLGVHADDFAPQSTARGRLRAEYDVPKNGIVILTVGRFSSAEKATVAPMFIALERAAQENDVPLHLWMVGWTNRDAECTVIEQGAAQLCPSVTVRLIDGRDPGIRRSIWSGADIFTLPVDSLQETYGLAPVEAMAAGLPVVVPDWDGFRDTVEHEETGFLVPTRMTRPGGGKLLAERMGDGTDSYLQYLSLAQQQTAIDLPAYADMLSVLIANPYLRKLMGDAGQDRVRSRFDWSQVMPQYDDLAQDLAMQRMHSAPLPDPIHMDPFDLYRSYPSHKLRGSSMLSVTRAPAPMDLDELDQINGRALYSRWIAPNFRLSDIAEVIQDLGKISYDDLCEKMRATPGTLEASLLFLIKYDYVRVED